MAKKRSILILLGLLLVLPLLLTIIRPIIVTLGILLLALAIVTFGMPGWAPGERKPDRETLAIIVVATIWNLS